MLHRYLSFALIFILFVGCNNDDNDFVQLAIEACGVENPLEDLEWLRAEVERRKNDASEDARYCYISQFEQNETTYFLYEDCNPLVDKVISVYNCEGENVGFIGDDNFPFQNLIEVTVIFRPKNTLCNFVEN